ncbi:winged helix-turn-helix transcriptional regulator [Natronorarus salvus]|uniref:winged helix-turn-helix transcriptional regulator n=1 Tax=Natronorarus salvus TaxID=3117733 RepID=UPI002F26C421
MTSDPDRARRVVETVDLISKKWHPVIIQRLMTEGPQGFNALKGSIDGISAKVLTDSLEDLTENGLAERTVISESPLRVEYALTDHGRALQTAMEALAEWGEEYLDPDPEPTVLVVDDDPRLASMHAGWLDDEFDVDRAYDGEEAFKRLSEEIDVLLIDRRMPGMGGEEVVERIDEWDLDCRVVMLSAVEPDFDIIGMGIDAYLVKPVVKEELVEAITEVLGRTAHEAEVQEYLALSAKRALLRARKGESELAASEEYARLEDRIDDLEGSISDPGDEAADDDRIRTVVGEEQ